MPAYQVWLLNDSYSKFMYLDGWLKLAYRVGLNQMCGASIDLKANDPKIETIALMKRLLILRDGVVVWGGLLQTEGWVVEGSAPTGDTYFLDALDYAAYLDWRTIPRPDGEDYDWYEDHADNVAKAVVRNHLGVSALAARQFSDLTVAADVSAVASCQRSLVAGTVLERLIALAALKHFYWRIVPGAAGCTFTTYYPLAGLDRTRGNGVNDEIVFTPDRKNVQRIAYKKDLTAHYNHIYVAGPGEGKDQLMAEREGAADVDTYRRRERWINASEYSTVAGLEGVGDRELVAARPYENAEVTPAPNILSPENLGDKVSIEVTRYGRVFAQEAVVKALDVLVDSAGIETVKPELEAQ